jgi:protein phosphatase
LKLLAWSRTDTGRKRDHNEDNFVVVSELELFAVADGMGGHQGGEHASRLALEVFSREVGAAQGDFEAARIRIRQQDKFRTVELHIDPKTGEPLPGPGAESDDDDDDDDDDSDDGEIDRSAASAIMSAAARKASSAVFAAALDDPELRGMGTTMTAMLHHRGKMHLCHAGDSRCYLLRDGKIQQLTEDHSWIQEQIKLGVMSEAEAKTSQFRHIITRSVGFERDVEVDCTGIAVEAGDCFLLCSDGMSNYVDGEELGEVMARTWYRRLPETLINMANDRGGDDNITVIVIYAANDTE